jgi:NDP-sugar pyrophosphorylase family protein
MMKAVVLAGGKGRRLAPIHKDYPKAVDADR